MSQGLTNTKHRIQSISSTKKITKAMELVATVKLKKWLDNMQNIKSYLEVMKEIISSCASGADVVDAIEMKHFKNATSVLYVVVTSSLGLCGGYNYNLFKYLNSFLTKDDKVLIIGTKGFSKLSHEGIDINGNFIDILDDVDILKAKSLCAEITDEYRSGKFSKVVLVSTLYKNSLTFIPSSFQLLPIEDIEKNDNLMTDTLFEPSKEAVLETVVPKFLNTFLYGRLVEALVCEQAARRNAMDNATDNAEELLEKLRIEYNKARQSAITQEITEVVAGASNA